MQKSIKKLKNFELYIHEYYQISNFISYFELQKDCKIEETKIQKNYI